MTSSGSGRSSSTVMRVLGLVFAGVGILLIVVGVLVGVLVGQADAARTSSTTGTVVALEEKVSRTTHDGRTTTSITYCPTIQYTVDARPYEFRSSSCGNTGPESVVGGTVNLRYNPDAPGDVAIDSWASRWLATTILCGLGVLFTAVGVVIVVVSRRTAGSTASAAYPSY